MKRSSDISGMKFGMLTVVNRAKKSSQGWLWECVCDCGSKTLGLTARLKSGRKKSCGCIQGLGYNSRHGFSGTPEYISYKSMRKRCNNPRSDSYSNYGGRGIKVCERWSSFKNFIEDMGPKPHESSTIDRIDPDGDYTPDNCKWSTKHEQSYNRRIMKNNTSGYTGVNFNNGRWVARRSFGGTRYELGRYVLKEEAILAVMEFERKVQKGEL